MANQVYDYVTEAMIKALESGTVPWRRPWKDMLPPMNFKSKKPYRGINYFLTAFSEFKSPYWLTYKQATELGGTVKPGSESHMVVFFKIMEYENKLSKNDTKKVPLLRYYRVFNLEQIDGIEVPASEVVKFNPNKKAEDVILCMPNRPTMEYGGDRALYHPMTDTVRLPNKTDFTSPEEFYCTAFHELAHSTGHENRLKRFLSHTPTQIFGSESYSKEELIAEMTAAFLCAHSGINQTLENSASYIQSWLKALKGDSKLVVQAANAAQKAADLIINKKDAEE